MLRVVPYFLSCFFLLLTTHLPAQKNIAGTWEGDLGMDQFLQLNIVQNGDRVCGYSWDYVKGDKRSYCKAHFTGYYDKEKNKWVLLGSRFIENSGSHFLMKMTLGNHSFTGENVLEGVSALKSAFFTLLNGGGNDEVYLKKVASRPQKMLKEMEDCFPKENRKKDSVAVPPPPITRKKTDSIVKKDTLVKIIPPVAKPDTTVRIIKKLPERKNKEQSRIEVNVRSITLNVYDNAIIDGDTVSIFYNGKLLLGRQRLSEKPIVINLELDEKQTRHEVILVAENLGGIPPNTALIVVYAGNKRHELFSSASLEENAVLVFDYVPK